MVSFSVFLWITLCVNAYKTVFRCGMQQTVIFLQFNGCSSKITPYNAPPLTRNNGLAATGSVEEKQNRCLTLKEENVIYVTSRQHNKMLSHCSLTIYQTICVGTRRIDISDTLGCRTFGYKKISSLEE